MSRDVGYLPKRAAGEPRRILVAGNGEGQSDQAGGGQEEPVDGEDRPELSQVVTARIEELRLTRIELAKRSGVGVSTIRQIEHPKGPRVFGPKVLEAISKPLELPPGYLVRVAYPPSSEIPDPTVQAMMAALAPYLEKIDAIPGLQADVAAIKANLGITIDPIHKANDSLDTHQGSDERRDPKEP
jgi:transcriptional regulator with XRE-family HTH domain